MNAHTTRRLLACVALGAGLGHAMLQSPEANADSSSFLDAVHDLGWYNRVNGDVGLLSQGYSVCRAMDNGANGDTVARIIYRTTDTSVSAQDAMDFVVVSVEELCPYHDHRGEDVA